MSALADDLRAIGAKVEEGPQGFVRVPAYAVKLGRHAGEAIDISLVSTDYPKTPPAGVHIHAVWGADKPNVHASALGADWRYWSRKLPNWRGTRTPHAILAYVHKVLADA